MYKKILLICVIVFSYSIYADQEINIVGGSTMGLPKIDIVKFKNDDNDTITHIILQDLGFTGEFNLKKYDSISDIDNNPDYIISGNGISKNVVNLVLTNAKSKKNIFNQNITTNNNAPRFLAHLISDAIYQKLTQVKGSFTSKIAYILQTRNTYNIIISDYDGYNPVNVVSATAPLISLAWNKNNQKLAYVSLESGKPVVYVQDLYSGTRKVVANFNGSNSSPAFIPLQNQLAVTLTKDYGSHIFIINDQPFSKSSPAISFIKFGTIDTEASFDDHGNVVFTSDHDGGPQIFTTDLKGTTPTRLTVGLGNYNTTARFSHDGSKIVFINRNFGTLKTYLLDLGKKNSYPLSTVTNSDMAPSFAPNDKMVLLSSDNHIYIDNSTGTSEQILNQINGSGTGKIIDQRWSN